MRQEGQTVSTLPSSCNSLLCSMPDQTHGAVVPLLLGWRDWRDPVPEVLCQFVMWVYLLGLSVVRADATHGVAELTLGHVRLHLRVCAHWGDTGLVNVQYICVGDMCGWRVGDSFTAPASLISGHSVPTPLCSVDDCGNVVTAAYVWFPGLCQLWPLTSPLGLESRFGVVGRFLSSTHYNPKV